MKAFGIVLLAFVALATASIEPNEPVRVTNKNSGPIYDIDLENRPKPEEPEQPQGAPSGEREADQNVGRVSIRRIFLVPMMPGPVQPPDSLWGAPSNRNANNNEDDKQAARRPFLFGGASDPDHSRPFFPLSLSHLFGQDSASRSPNQDESVQQPKISANSEAPKDSEESADSAAREQFQSAMIDPIKMMIDMMHQAMQQHARELSQVQPQQGDLNKEASNNNNKEGEKANEESKPMKPSSETKEEVVEIEGKKYLRKTVVSKHVGDNMIFMTRRLIFMPLNETDSSVPTTTTTTLAPSTTLFNEPSVASTTDAPKKLEESSTSPVKPEPSSTLTSQTQPEDTTASVSSTATPSAKPERLTATE